MTATDPFLRQARCPAAVLACLLLAAVGLAQAPPPTPGAPAASGNPIVADVLIPGNFQMSDQQIRNLIKTRVGQEYNKLTTDEDVRKLSQTNHFAKVVVHLQEVEGNKVNVYFVLTPHQSTIQEVIYDGAKHLKQDDLDSATGLRKGQPLNPLANQTARQAILRKYREKGRMFASVELVEGGKPTDTRVRFRITEGRAVKVCGIEFTGNTFVVAGRLRTQTHTFAARILGAFGGDFNADLVDNDVLELEKYYKQFGFQDVVVSRELQWNKEHSAVTVIFHIREGQRYRVADVKVGEGRKTFSDDKILSVVKTKSGDWYDETAIKEDVENIKALYGYTGREAKTQQQVIWRPNGEVTVRYDIAERQPARVGQIVIVGNEVTKQNVILRQIPLYPGQILTYPDLRRGEANLSRLNIFEMNQEKGIRPTLEVLDPQSDNPVKDILVNVQETRTGSLMFGVGANSNSGLTGSIVLNERNFDITNWPTSFDQLLSGNAFRGGGQEFRIQAMPGTIVQSYNATWREPFLFDSPNSLTVSGSYYQRYFNEYEEERVGPRVSLGRRLNQFWSISETIRVEGVSAHNVAVYAPLDYQSVIGQNLLVGGLTSVTRDSRDSYIRPTQGSLVTLGFEEVTGTYTFPLVNIQGNKYFTIYQRADGSGRHVLAVRRAKPASPAPTRPSSSVTSPAVTTASAAFNSAASARKRPMATWSAATSCSSTVPSTRFRSWPTTPSTRSPSWTPAPWAITTEPPSSLRGPPTPTASPPALVCASRSRCSGRCRSPWTSAFRS